MEGWIALPGLEAVNLAQVEHIEVRPGPIEPCPSVDVPREALLRFRRDPEVVLHFTSGHQATFPTTTEAGRHLYRQLILLELLPRSKEDL